MGRARECVYVTCLFAVFSSHNFLVARSRGACACACAWQPAITGTMTAGGLPIDGESLLRFKKHHAPVTFEAARTAAVVLDTLSFRQLALAVLGIVGSCALAAATASVLGLRATRRETIDTYDCKALTSGPWQDRATREQPCRGADGRTESLASSPF